MVSRWRGGLVLVVATLVLSAGAMAIAAGLSAGGGSDASGGSVSDAAAAGGDYADVVAYVTDAGLRLARDPGVVEQMAAELCPVIDGHRAYGAAVQQARKGFVRGAVSEAGGALTRPLARRLFNLLVEGCVAGGHSVLGGQQS